MNTLITDPRGHRALWVQAHPRALLENGGIFSREDLERWACDACMAPLDPARPIKVKGGPEGMSLCAKCAPDGDDYQVCPCAACQRRIQSAIVV